jgi:enamine deaminase RidA (YjgF/YER057c/UK114 family)
MKYKLIVVMQPNQDLWSERLTLQQYSLLSNDEYDNVMGVIGYGNVNVNRIIPNIVVNTKVLLTDYNIYEIWFSNLPLQHGTMDDILYTCNEDLLFGCLNVAHESIQIATEAAYQQLFNLQDKLGYVANLRIWNYFSSINEETNGVERYRQFNIGRQNALLTTGRSTTKNLPAASVLGTNRGDLSIAFIASRAQVINIENPRQVSSYYYPKQYGLRAPAFSRASIIKLHDAYNLFISGTASIVGHETWHQGDVAKQTIESMNNINAALAETKRQVPSVANLELDCLWYKIYIRHPNDLPLIYNAFTTYIGSTLQPQQAIYLQADICRADLLVEIEAHGSSC